MAIILPFTIDIALTSNSSFAQVLPQGREERVITENDRNTFKINDIELKRAVATYYGRAPDNVFVKSSDYWPDRNWADLYSRYNQPEVKTVIEVLSSESRVLSVIKTPAPVIQKIFKNSSSYIGNFDTSTSYTRTASITSGWTYDNIKQSDFTSSANIKIGVLGVSVDETLSTQDIWGKGKTETQQVSLTTTTSISGALNPNQEVATNIKLNRYQIKVEVKYKIYLTGMVALNYGLRYKDHHFWFIPIENIMNATGITNSKIVTQVITVNCFDKDSSTASTQ